MPCQRISTQKVRVRKNAANIEAVKFWEQTDEPYQRCYIHSQDLLARITAQTSRQSGYSAILTELLNYEGNEIYFKSIPPEFIGKTFKDALFVMNQVPFHPVQSKVNSENVTVFGIQQGNAIWINPLMTNEDITLTANDKLILLAEDDDNGTLKLIDQPNIDETAIVTTAHHSIDHEKVLIVGWNENACTILKQLANYLKSGSEIVVVADRDHLDDQIRNIQVNNGIRIETRYADTTSHAVLEQLEITNFDNIIILGYPGKNIQERDAKTLLTLLHLRKILEVPQSTKEINIVSEMSDDRNRRLAESSNACDFIISDNIISTMMAQLAETKELKPVFDELFDVSGCEIYLRPVTDYITVSQAPKVNFNTIIQSALQKKEIAIGYRKIQEAHQPDKHYGISLNPNKLGIIEFIPNDKIIVIAQS